MLLNLPAGSVMQFSVEIKENEMHRFKIIWYGIEVIETRIFYFALNCHLLTATQVTSFHLNFLTMWKKHKKNQTFIHYFMI